MINSVSDIPPKPEPSVRTLSILVENKFGVLSRIAGVISARGYNIESLTVAGSSDPTLSRITMAVRCEPHFVGQIIKQVGKLIDVVKIEDLTESDCVERELVLVRVRAQEEKRPALLNEVGIFGARVVTATSDSFVLEVIGDPQEIDAFLEVMRVYGLDDTVRTGKVALPRSSEARSNLKESTTYPSAATTATETSIAT